MEGGSQASVISGAADFLDDAAALMAEEEGKIVGAEDAVLGGEVRVADAAC